MSHFGGTFSPLERIFFLHHLHLLVLNWVAFEYDRYLLLILIYALLLRNNIFVSFRCTKNKSRVFGTSDPNLRYPMAAVEGLLKFFVATAETGLKMARKESKSDSSKDQNDMWIIFLNEVLTMFYKVRDSAQRKIEKTLN